MSVFGGGKSRVFLVFLSALALFALVNLRSSLVLTAPITPSCDTLPQTRVFRTDDVNAALLPVVTECQTLCECLRRRALSEEESNVIPSAASLWKSHAPQILETSIRLAEAENKTTEYKQWVEHLFSWTTPSRLTKSFETFPQDLVALKSLYSILQQRFENPDTARPLKVAVFGGSLTAGHGCLENPLGMATQSFLKRQLPCAWPDRVQDLLNVFAPGLVNITNMAMAATTSDVGATVVDYQLWPAELLPDGPDIIVASFSTNDALADAPETKIYENMQLLIESIHKERNCKTNKLPLLFYIDDFIAWPGPAQKWLDFHHDLHELADWHGFGYISYANAFRDIVQADLMQEETFKGKWTIAKRKHVANPHPGLSFHIVMSWLISYNILHLSMHVCDGLLYEVPPKTNAVFPMVTVPSVQRPPLDAEILTQDLPKKWKELEASEKQRCASMSSGPRCGFVWVANRVSEIRSTKAIEAFLKPFLISNDGWKGDGSSYTNKHGWVAQKENARFSLEIPALETEVRYLTILALQSYGEKWKDSRMRMTVNGEEFFIEGFHDSETSVILPHKFGLGDTIAKGGSIKATFDLVGGSTFKVSGMAFCSS